LDPVQRQAVELRLGTEVEQEIDGGSTGATDLLDDERVEDRDQ
jgi:hypothetical protein